MPTPTLNVVPLPAGNLQDIPGMLRRLADQLENGKEPEPLQVVVVVADVEGMTECYCYGDVPILATAIGVLQFGIHKLALTNG